MSELRALELEKDLLKSIIKYSRNNKDYVTMQGAKNTVLEIDQKIERLCK